MAVRQEGAEFMSKMILIDEAKLSSVLEVMQNQGDVSVDEWIAVEKALREAMEEQPAQQALDKMAENARELGLDYEPAQQEPVAWKLVPIEPTEEMLKAMDECSKEGYDERLYAGHAASVYMAAVDAAPTPPAQRKPLTDEQIIKCWGQVSGTRYGYVAFARAIEAAHGIKENT